MVVMWAGRADNQGLCWSRPRRKRQQPHREGASGGRMHSVFTVQASKPLIRELHSRPPPPTGACYRGSYNRQAWDN